MARVTRTRWCLLALLLVGVISLAYTKQGIAETPPAPTGVSWNPNVNCVPVVTTFENMMGTNLNSFNGGLLAGSQYATYNLKYFDQNGTGSFQPGDPVVYDINNNGVADVTAGKNDQFYSTVTSGSADRSLSTSPSSLVSGSLVGKPLKTEPRLKYIDGSTTAYYNTTNGSWDAGEQNIGETVVFDANDNSVVVVEIRGVYPVVWDYTLEDCASVFNGINGGGNFTTRLCDSSGNMQTFGIHGDCGGVIHTACGHRIHFEIDMDWQAKGWCGPASSYCNNSTLSQNVASGSSGGSTSIDVQGFIYWDPTEVTTPGHNYSGWELHPFTAWRLSASLATTIEDSANNPVASIMAGTAVHDTAIISEGSGVYTGTVTYSLFTGPTCAGTGTIVGGPVTVTNGIVPNSASQSFNTAGSFSWSAVYSGDANNNGADSPCEPLTVNPSITVNFAFSPIKPALGQKVAFSGSATGGTPPYVSWTWNFGDDSPPSFEATIVHSYSKPGSYTVQLTVTDSTGINATSASTITILENRTILGLDRTFFYEMITSLGVAVATTALGLHWKRTRRHLDSTA
ncbi:PKD domain-containing protein [Candidatus Bathyarchaeota archaeon]|nr:MAG: PKD domain-containing protein [Candidatus Bathyarchaeota archaeon]